jgi:hypothetical protein
MEADFDGFHIDGEVSRLFPIEGRLTEKSAQMRNFWGYMWA